MGKNNLQSRENRGIKIMIKKLISPTQLRETLGIGKTTYYKWMKHENLPTTKVGKKVYHIEEQVETWFNGYNIN